MLDIRFIRENLDLVKDGLKNRNSKLNIDEVIELDNARKKILIELEELRSQKNKANDEISALLKEKKDPKERIASMKSIAERIDKLDDDIRAADEKLNTALLYVPNVPHASVPVGAPDKAQVIRSWG